MAPIILSARLCGELEDLVLRTPSAKERCRARRCSGSPRGSPPSKSPRRSRSAVRPSTTGSTASSGATTSSSGHACSTPRGRAAPLRSPRSSTPGLRRPSLAIPASRVIMPRSGPPSCCSTTWSTLMGSRPPSRASAWRSHAWVSAGNGPGMSWRHGRRPGAKQKGAETRPEGSHAQGNLDAGRDDRHGDTSAV